MNEYPPMLIHHSFFDKINLTKMARELIDSAIEMEFRYRNNVNIYELRVSHKHRHLLNFADDVKDALVAHFKESNVSVIGFIKFDAGSKTIH